MTDPNQTSETVAAMLRMGLRARGITDAAEIADIVSTVNLSSYADAVGVVDDDKLARTLAGFAGTATGSGPDTGQGFRGTANSRDTAFGAGGRAEAKKRFGTSSGRQQEQTGHADPAFRSPEAQKRFGTKKDTQPGGAR